MPSRFVELATAAFVAGASAAALAYFAGKKSHVQGPGVYTLVVCVKLKPGCLQAFRERFAVLANDVKAKEPRCLSYGLQVKEPAEGEEATEVMIFERYVSKEDLTVTHRAGEEFKAFGKWLNEGEGAALVESKTVAAYNETDVGYVYK